MGAFGVEALKLRWLFWVLIVGCLGVIVSRFTDLQGVLVTLARGQWRWVFIAALLQVIYYIFYTGLYQSSFNTVEVEARLSELLPLTFASIFVSVVAPSGGISGAALFVDDAARRDQSPARAAAGTLLVLIADLSAFTFILIFGLFYLFRRQDLEFYEIVAGLILLVIIGGLNAVLLLGLRRPDSLLGLLIRLQRLFNAVGIHFNRPHLLSDSWAERNANEFAEAALAIAAHPRRFGRVLVIAMAAHLINLSSLHAVFLAFHQPVGFELLTAAYAVGILFWIIAITPQGIGVVEGVMALVIASLGVPADRALVIALAFRGLTFWLPFITGFVLMQRGRLFSVATRARSEVWSIHLVALLTGAMGFINVLSAVTPTMQSRLLRLSSISPLGVRHGGRLTATLAGFALIILASNLWRRKRVAWLMTVIILVISAISHLLKGLDIEVAVLALGLAAWMIYLRPHFHARSDPPSIRQGIQMVVASGAFTLAYGVAGFYLLDHQFRVHFGLQDALRQTIIMFTQFYDPGLQPVTGLGRYFADSIYIVGVVTMGYAFLMLVRPVLLRRPALPAERSRASGIVAAHGHSSLARLGLMNDKSYHFSPGGSVIAYVVQGRVAFALGDPIGPGSDALPAVQDFRNFCAQNDWMPAFYQVLPDGLAVYQQASFDALCVGHEAIVTLETYTLSGRHNKGLRSAVNRVERLGYTARHFPPPIPHKLVEEMRVISDEWLSDVQGTEKRFSVGWFDTEYITNSHVSVLYSPEEQPVAFANLLPEYQANEVAVDLMRYRHTGEHGLMEFLFNAMFEWAKGKGYTAFNLGLSALSGIGQEPRDPVIERTLHYIYEHVNQFYNFKGLHEFKEKFNPCWSPRYLIYPGLATLPMLTIALIRADSGGDVLGGYLRHPK
jgi:phosphatidylglycerol lysyltransferase